MNDNFAADACCCCQRVYLGGDAGLSAWSQPSGLHSLLLDGGAGGVEKGAVTLEPCMHLVDEWATASEREIAAAMLGLREHERMRVEGAAGVAAACFLQQRAHWEGKTVVIVVCGRNVGDDAFAEAQRLVESA